VLSKVDQFSQIQQDISGIAKALAHPARLAILMHLAGLENCQCGDIVEQMPLAQSTVSQHLKNLKDAGLIKGEIDGPRTCYCLNTEAIARFRKDFNALFDQMDAIRKRAACC
jgi:ArsR family transcriptional regulator, arsenate/arsenite/antimonite-responsive transcriptional repressor